MSLMGLEKTLKKVEKTFKKGIDKQEKIWYNERVAVWSGGEPIIENWTTREKYKAYKSMCETDLEQFLKRILLKQK